MAIQPEGERQRIPPIIYGCLKAALQDEARARACREHFEQLRDAARLGEGFAHMFGESWGLEEAQLEELRKWPESQLALLRDSVIQASRMVESRKEPLRARVVGRAGVPRSVSVTLDEEGYFEIVFVGPVLV